MKIIIIFPHDPFYEGIFSHVSVSVHCIFPKNTFVWNAFLSNFWFQHALPHRTTGCFDDRLLTRMTDTGFLVAWRVGYNFRLVKFEEKPSGTLWWISTLAGVERSYRNKLTLLFSQIKPHLIIISELSWKKSQKNGYLFRLCVSPSKSAVCTSIQ